MIQENERKSPDRYLKWAHAFVVVYSITSRASYDEARSYLDTIAQYQRITGKDIPVAVVGNKMDLERYRSVFRHRLKTFISHVSMYFHIVAFFHSTRWDIIAGRCCAK